ncbi:TPA: inverse autotransporter beta domain-containing protein, partial [Vibrio harveyi]
MFLRVYTTVFTLLWYILSSLIPVYSQASSAESLVNEQRKTTLFASPLRPYTVDGAFVNYNDAQYPLWVLRPASDFSSWSEVNQKTQSSLESVLEVNKATKGTPYPTMGKVWVHAPLYQHHFSTQSSLPSLGTDKSPLTEDPTFETRLASELSQAGSAVEGNGLEGYVQNLDNRVLNLGDSAIEGGVTDWFSHYGTVKFSTDWLNNLDDPSASLDLLLPLYDNNQQLFFTQLGYQYNNEAVFNGRDFLNVGFGFRTRGESALFGINSFYDSDLSRGHRRGSIGVEYFQDYLKISGNYYFPLSDWKDSPDLEYYLERPAEGMDEKITGYLPIYPQLGGSLEYEQYYGDEVDITGSQHREKDPYAVTLEGEYTPVPAVTLHAGVTNAKGKLSSLEAGLDFTYRFGLPWEKQLSPDYVAESRQLSWQWRDLVERNNNIVLEYKKKEVFTATSKNYHIQALNAPHYGTPLTLKVMINGQSPLSAYDVQWHLPSQFIFKQSTHDQYVQSSTRDSIEVWVPPFGGEYSYSVTITHRDSGQVRTINSQIMVDSSNLNSLSLIAKNQVDLSKPDTTLETHFLAGNETLEQAWLQYIHLASKENPVPPFARFQSGVSLNALALPVVVAPNKVELHTKDHVSSLSSVIKDVNHSFEEIYEFDGKHNVFPIVIGGYIGTPIDISTYDSVKVTSGALADGKEKNTVTVTLKDSKNNPVSGENIIVTSPGSNAKVGAVIDNGDGTYSAQVTDTRAEMVKITVSHASDTKTVSMKFVANRGSVDISQAFIGAPVTTGANASKSSIQVLPDGAIANDKDKDKLTVTLKDSSGNVVPNMPVTFSTSASDSRLVGLATSSTNAQGEATIEVASSKAGDVAVLVTVAGKSKTVIAHFVAGAAKTLTLT